MEPIVISDVPGLLSLKIVKFLMGRRRRRRLLLLVVIVRKVLLEHPIFYYQYSAVLPAGH